VRYSSEPEVGGACEAARLRASLALDGELEDDLDQLLLKRHLDRCPECVAAVARLEAAAWLLRREPA
jgi:anti-sigma factor RsiW